ncbi:glycosyl transferase group 1 [Sodiomyces alkalinus F11]|uniref:Glycosyl transferase group 1 n=1 Tax=Sodiomyces alkalinus (strain CBS 110278 / VKM F-3762 / F11) TaxID=1314773 RepID=A0A3N2Q5C5_SODAK|nr:glycosyl transferase group 1 [Sodiomyces alkalinus F11]ROT41974.1 glycosyl transferase group 1 [Sodiomyces alkalinus F11]
MSQLPLHHPAGKAPRYPSHDYATFPEDLRGKRILLCTESFGPVNGVSRTTLMLVDHLRAHGALVAVVAPLNHTKHDTFAPSAAEKRPEDDTLVEVRLKGYPLPFNPELSVVYPVRVSTLFARTFGRDNPPDLIYLASPASLGFQVMLQVRQQPREKRVPIVCNFQTDLAGYCSILFPQPFSTIAVFAFALVQSYLFRHDSVKTLFYPSRFVRRYLEGQGVQPEKMELLRRGVNTKAFCPGRRSEKLRREIAPNGEIILICVSRIAGEKGFDFLAQAAKELDARGLPFKLYIVGGNRNPDVEREVQEMFDPLVDESKVIFAGFKSGEDLATAYASGDIFLHCSVTETFGLVVLESMASGVPVVARDEGGPSDIIDDGRCGHLLPPQDLHGFVDRVMALAKDPARRAAMAQEARSLACEATWEKINNQVAWRMVDTIEGRRRELVRVGHAQHPTLFANARALVQFYGWVMMNDAAREVIISWIVDAKMAGGLGIVITFWLFTGIYLVFTEVALWTKGRLPRQTRAWKAEWPTED